MVDVTNGAEPLENQRARCGPEKLPEPTCVRGSARSGLPTYLFHSKCSYHVFCQQLCIYQSHFNVFVDLSVVRPVLAAFYLQETRRK